MKKVSVIIIKILSYLMTLALSAMLAIFSIKLFNNETAFGDILNAVFILCSATVVISSLIFSIKIDKNDNNQGIALTAGMVNLIAFFVVWQAISKPILTFAFALCVAVPAILFIIELISQAISNSRND